MRVLMTGGGTGGHINPAVAIANTIKKNHPDAQIAFVGTKRGKEKELVPQEGYPLYFVDVQGISRSLTLRNIKALYLAWISPRRAKKLLLNTHLPISQVAAHVGFNDANYFCRVFHKCVGMTPGQYRRTKRMD